MIGSYTCLLTPQVKSISFTPRGKGTHSLIWKSILLERLVLVFFGGCERKLSPSSFNNRARIHSPFPILGKFCNAEGGRRSLATLVEARTLDPSDRLCTSSSLRGERLLSTSRVHVIDWHGRQVRVRGHDFCRVKQFQKRRIKVKRDQQINRSTDLQNW